ncbi:hypothetical protein [Veillonella magna]|uniref:hypothetical protein n=1 Tax=Veillonella magna TaxID=464322 RepID=UPI0019616856|nr:hypothetical protein [Veillonella magna]
MREKIFKYIDEHRQEMLTFWKELVSIESGTLFKEDVDRARDFLVKAFTDIGGTVTSYLCLTLKPGIWMMALLRGVKVAAVRILP